MLQAAIITAGGQARRFGSDKVLAELGGQSLLQRVAASLPVTPLRLIVSGNPTHTLAGWQTVPDLRAGLGPLAGLETGITYAPSGWVAFCAADMPHLTPEYWQELQANITPQAQAVIGLDELGRRQPLAALYHTAILPTVSARLDGQIYRMGALLAALPLQEVSWNALKGAAPHAFHNVNERQDLR